MYDVVQSPRNQQKKRRALAYPRSTATTSMVEDDWHDGDARNPVKNIAGV